MLLRTIALCLGLATVTATSVMANHSPDAEPVLRLRLQDPVAVPTTLPMLRPRFDADETPRIATVPKPRVTFEDAGRVGKFAFVRTPHPNLVLAVGATDDHAELGRQIDRAIMFDQGSSGFYNQNHDSAPFIGIGLKTNSQDRRWSVDATIGAGLMAHQDHTRLSNAAFTDEAGAFETEARANLRLRLAF
ncbi:MAG: hypothetical protein AAFO74_09715 [Pseudomonadota bacterium]